MKTVIRKATAADLDATERIYENIHTESENGNTYTGWIRGVYPTRDTARSALEKGELFVQEFEGKTVGTAIINQTQVDVYKGAPWKFDAPDSEVMVLHTLVIDPYVKGHGFGSNFVEFYEQYAADNGCRYLRIDTNALNVNAHRFYQKRGYREIGIVPCEFNGISGVKLVLIEKKLPEN